MEHMALNRTLLPVRLEAEVCAYLKVYYDRHTKCTRERAGIADDSKEDALASLLAALATPPSLTTFRYNTLKFQSAADAEQRLASFLKSSYDAKGLPVPPVSRHPLLPDILTVPCAGPRTCLQLDKQVVVDVSCGMAILRGADIYAPGVLSAPDGLAGQDVTVVVDLDRRCLKGTKLTRPFDLGTHVTVGNGRLIIARADLYCDTPPRGVAVVMTDPLYDSPSFGSGDGDGELGSLFFLQNAPSAVAAHVLDPQPGERVLDMCAAPGGKAAHIGALMQNKGLLVACERSRPKLQRLVANIESWGITCARVFCADSTRIVDEASVVGGDGAAADALDNSLRSCTTTVVDKKVVFPRGFFDRVLCDVPCSALGQRPQAINPMTLAGLAAHSPYQRKLLAIALKAARPGGIVVYSTCTINPEENEAVVQWALDHNPGLRLDEDTPRWGAMGGLRNCGLRDENVDRVLRFDPVHDPSAIGFFVARFVVPG